MVVAVWSFAGGGGVAIWNSGEDPVLSCERTHRMELREGGRCMEPRKRRCYVEFWKDAWVFERERGRGIEFWEEETLHRALGGEVVVWSFGEEIVVWSFGRRGCDMELWEEKS